MEPTSSPESTAPSSLFGRLANVIASPAEVFDELRTAPRRAANWLVPAILLAVIGAICGLVVVSQPAIAQQLREVRDQAIQKQVAKGEITAQDAERASATLEKLGPIFATVAAVVGAAMDGFARPFVAAAILWLLAVKVFKAPLPYLTAVEAAGLASVVLVLGRVINSLIVLVMGNLFVNASPILLVGKVDLSKASHLFLANLDAFSLWYLVVIAVALSRLTNVPLARAGSCCLAVWVVLGLLRSLPALTMS